MKRFVLKALAIITLALTCINTYAKDNPFDKFADSKDVTYIYISKAMLSLVGTNMIPSINGIDIAEISRKLNSIQIITSEKQTKQSLKSEAMSIIKKGKYDSLMQIAEENNKVDIFHKDGKDNSLIVMINDNESNTIVIVFSGTFNTENIMNMLQRNNK